ncbi:MAG: PAS domain-containing sensor histidine kinase [Bacteroidota bacterium]
MSTLNRLLSRQINKFFGNDFSIPDNLAAFFEIISETYNHSERDRKMLERSIDLSSKEMVELNNNLKKETLDSKRAHDELSRILSSIDEIIFSKDVKSGKYIYVSVACEKVYGYSVHEFMENPTLWEDVIYPEDVKLAESLYLGERSTLQYRIVHKDKSIRWIENTVIPTFNETGSIIRIDGVTADITKRKEFEIALQNSEERFRSLIEHSSDAITVINDKAEIIYASDSLFNITGYTSEELLGTSSSSYVHPEDLPEIQENFYDLVSNPGKIKTLSYRRLKKDGTYLWCEAVVANLIHQPAVKGMVINFRDITDRKKHLETIKSSNEELKKTNAELDKFVYSATHDLRAPLSSMKGIISFIEAETSDPLLREDIGLLKASVNKLDSFILDILDYSRNTRMEVEKEVIDFEELLNDSISNIKFMSAGNSNIDIKFHVIDDGAFYSDKGRISIILNNLISNAIRYSDPQSTKSFVEINVVHSNGNATISIKDNGVGIKTENHQKIFDMFYRVSKKSVGSGIGLYIVKETIEKLNGSITLESELGEGTTFNISIPNLYAINQ